VVAAMHAGERQVLLLFKKGASRVMQSPHDGEGELHVAFAIPSVELANWELWLQTHRIEVEEKRMWELGGWSLYFRDPDRHLIELATPGVLVGILMSQSGSPAEPRREAVLMRDEPRARTNQLVCGLQLAWINSFSVHVDLATAYLDRPAPLFALKQVSCTERHEIAASSMRLRYTRGPTSLT